MRGIRGMMLTAALLPLGAAGLRAQQPAPAEPTIPEARAQAIALRQVPNGEGVKSSKLKTKDGLLVYEFDIETPGPGHQEVRVNAQTGAVVSSRHEDDIVGTAESKVTHAAHEAGHTVEHAAHETGSAVEHAAHETGSAASRTADRVLTGDEVRNAHPRISERRAGAIALRRFPSAKKVKDADLERENGILVWKVDVDTPGEGHEEVLVDATSGRILRTHHEVGLAGKAKQEVEKITH